MKRDRDARSIHLSQLSYIDSILRRYNLDELKPLATPMDPNVHLSTADCPASTADHALMRNIDYRGTVGALMYAALGTRPDIAYAVSTPLSFLAEPRPEPLDCREARLQVPKWYEELVAFVRRCWRRGGWRIKRVRRRRWIHA